MEPIILILSLIFLWFILNRLSMPKIGTIAKITKDYPVNNTEKKLTQNIDKKRT